MVSALVARLLHAISGERWCSSTIRASANRGHCLWCAGGSSKTPILYAQHLVVAILVACRQRSRDPDAQMPMPCVLMPCVLRIIRFLKRTTPQGMSSAAAGCRKGPRVDSGW